MSEDDLMKRQLEAQLADYETALAEYAAFYAAWRARNPEYRGFRCKAPQGRSAA